MAFLYEETDQYQKASQAFYMSWAARRNANWGTNNTDKHLLASLQRVMEANGIQTTRVVTISDSQKGETLLKGDLIIKLNSKSIMSVDELRNAYDSKNGESFFVTLIRDGITYVVQPNEAFRSHKFINNVVPTSMLAMKIIPTPFSQLHNKWAAH